MKTLPAQLRAWRRRLGLSQSGAALRLGIPKRTVENWEQGTNAPRGLALQSLLATIRTPSPPRLRASAVKTPNP